MNMSSPIKAALSMAFFVFLLAPQGAKAIDIPIEWGPHIARLQKLPKTEEYNVTVGKRVKHFDLGVRYKRISILWTPLWHYGKPQYVIYTSTLIGDDICNTVNSNFIEELNKSLDLQIPLEPKIPFWARWRARFILLGLVVAFVVFGALSHKKDTAKAAIGQHANS